MANRILTILAIFLTLAYPVKARNYVVCVGIADYPGTKSDLNVSNQDAKTMKVLYDSNGNAEVRLLTDKQATKTDVISTIDRLFTKAGEDDAIIMFFSGHGIPGGFVCYDGMLKYETVTDIMKRSKAKNKIIFADACYAGKARNGKRHSQKHSNTTVLFFLSSRTGETSQERRKWHNSLFTAYLERGLRGGADSNRDRIITARELFDFVSKGVSEASQQKQHPVMWGRFEDQMPLMIWPKK